LSSSYSVSFTGLRGRGVVLEDEFGVVVGLVLTVLAMLPQCIVWFVIIVAAIVVAIAPAQ